MTEIPRVENRWPGDRCPCGHLLLVGEPVGLIDGQWSCDRCCDTEEREMGEQ